MLHIGQETQNFLLLSLLVHGIAPVGNAHIHREKQAHTDE